MMTYPNDPAPTTFQPLHHPIGAAGAMLLAGGKPSISPYRENFIEDIALCHLDTPSKRGKVQGLRDHIKLPSGCRDAQFLEQEKKETNWVLCLHSSSTAR